MSVASDNALQSTLDALEDFWDSGYPRFGEDEARGWKFARPIGRSHEVEAVRSRPKNAMPNDPYSNWALQEKEIQGYQRRPARTDDIDMDDDDPYRCVVFDDIRPFLFPVGTLPGRTSLIYIVLELLGLHIGEQERSTGPTLPIGGRKMATEAFLGCRAVQSKPRQAWQVVGGEAMDPARQTRTIPLADQPVRQWATDLDTLYAEHWFREIDVATIDVVDQDMIRSDDPNPSPAHQLMRPSATCFLSCDRRYSSPHSIGVG